MLIIGITGGSGCGKSTVSKLYCDIYGAATIDADEVYHDLLNNSAPMMKELKRRFPEAVTGDKLNRKTLAGIVFSDKAALSDLNDIAHKFIIEETERRMSVFYQRNAEYLCIDAIALFESGLDSICDVTIGITAPRAQRIARIINRDSIDSMSASARINAQPDDNFYIERCDYMIANNGNMDEIRLEAERIFNIITKGTDDTDE